MLFAAVTSEKKVECSSWNWKFYLMKKCIIPLFIVCGLIYLEAWENVLCLLLDPSHVRYLGNWRAVQLVMWLWWTCRSALELVIREANCGPRRENSSHKLSLLAFPESWLKIHHWFFCASFEMYYLSLLLKLYKMHLANTPKKPAHKNMIINELQTSSFENKGVSL